LWPYEEDLRIIKKRQADFNVVYFLIGTSLTLFVSIETINPILPLYITQKGANYLQLGVIISLLSFTGMITKLPLGILAEKVGKWPMIPIALLGQSITLLLYSIAPSPEWFYPIRIFHALFVSAFAPTAISLVADSAPRGKEGDIMGRFLTSFGMSAMFGPFFCSFLLKFFDFAKLMQAVAIIPFIGFMIFLYSRYRHSFFLISNEKEFSMAKSGISLSSLRKIVFSRNIIIISYMRITFFFTGAFFTTLWAVYVSENLFLTASLIALFFGVKGITNTMFRVPSGRFTDRMGYRWSLLLAYLMMMGVFFLLSNAKSIYLLFGILAIYGLAHAMRAVAEWTLLGVSAPPQLRGVASAYLSTMSNVGQALGALAAGILGLVLSLPSIFQLASLLYIPTIVAPFLIRQISTNVAPPSDL